MSASQSGPPAYYQLNFRFRVAKRTFKSLKIMMLKVRFRHEADLKNAVIQDFEGPESAPSGDAPGKLAKDRR
jgi:hypothetical protein